MTDTHLTLVFALAYEDDFDARPPYLKAIGGRLIPNTEKSFSIDQCLTDRGTFALAAAEQRWQRQNGHRTWKTEIWTTLLVP
jgi:hypothetical protein